MKDWKYILYVAVGIGVFVALKLISPKQYNWQVTFAKEDMNPYGGYVIGQLIPSIFPNGQIKHSYQTIYEMQDSLGPGDNLLIISNRFTCDEADTRALLRFVDTGGNVFISAQNFWGHLADTLKLQAWDHLWSSSVIPGGSDSTYLRFTSPSSDTTTQRYYYRSDNVANYFRSFDTLTTSVIARNRFDQPVTIRVNHGKGNLILNSTPFAFTNIYLLADHNHQFVSRSLSALPEGDVFWTEYYQFGRMEARSPLRVILTRKPLRWAYYITIGSLLIFILFEMKRRQRIIPVVKPPENTSLQFVSTIGNLYFQNKDHKNIAEKKIQYFLEQIRTTYWLSTSRIDDGFMDTLARKSGKPKEDVRRLFETMAQIRSQSQISEEQLMELNAQIEKFTNDKISIV